MVDGGLGIVDKPAAGMGSGFWIVRIRTN